MLEVQQFGTDARYGPATLHQCEKRVKSKIQNVLGANSYVCKSYRRKIGGGIPPSGIGLRMIMKWTDIGKNYFTKLFALDHGASTWFNPIYQVPFAKLCSGLICHFPNFLFVTFHYSISEIPHEIAFVLFSKVSNLSKHRE